MIGNPETYSIPKGEHGIFPTSDLITNNCCGSRSQLEASGHLSRLLLTPRQTASALAICEKTLWTYTQNGQIPCVRIGRSVRYSPVDLQNWIACQKATGGAA